MTVQPDSLASPWLLALPVLFLLGGLLLQRRRASAAATAAIMVEARPAGVKRAEASFPDINPFQRQVPDVTEMTMDEYLGHGADQMPAPVAAPVQPMPSLDDMIVSLPTDLDELIGMGYRFLNMGADVVGLADYCRGVAAEFRKRGAAAPVGGIYGGR
jgi:hypothetical protein